MVRSAVFDNNTFQHLLFKKTAQYVNREGAESRTVRHIIIW